MLNKKEIRDAVEEAIEELDGIPKDRQKNLLGSKKKYVDAIVKKLAERLK
jgi:ribosomal protein S2